MTGRVKGAGATVVSGRLALVLAVAAISMTPAAATAEEGVRATITVRVYQTAGLEPTFEQRALAEARRVLGAALVDVRWRPCHGRGHEPSVACGPAQGSAELSLRLLRGNAPRSSAATRLGEALMDRRAGAAVMATVYVNRVERMANVAGRDAAVLLGRVTAHELGHLLMRTAEHAHRGLMRPRWTTDEVRRDRAGDWMFTSGDVAAMRQPGPSP
jgi:hypothetical protein